MYIVKVTIYTVSQETVQNHFCQNFVNFPPTCEFFWHNDSKEDKLMCGALTFHLT